MAISESALAEMRKMQSVKQRGAKCTIGLLIKTIGEDDSQALAEAMADELIDSTTISVWLGNRGHQIKRHTVARHRRKECRCNG